jgi:PleD family two-component response regulator
VTSPDAQSKRLERGTSREVVKNSKNETLVIAFARDISDRKALEVKLENLASLDYLTQVANRRQFDQYLESEWQRAWRD